MQKLYSEALSQHPVLVGLMSVILGAVAVYFAFELLTILIHLFFVVLPYAIAIGVVALIARYAFMAGKNQHK